MEIKFMSDKTNNATATAVELDYVPDAEGSDADTLENFVKGSPKGKKSKSKAKGKAKTAAKAKAPAKKAPAKSEKKKEEEPKDTRGTTSKDKALFKAANATLARQQAAGAALDMIEALPNFNDEQVRDLYLKSHEAGKVVFLVNGAIAYEIYKRVSSTKRFLNRKGQGVKNVFNELATEIGVDVNTLYQDFRIFDAFGDYLIGLLAEDKPELLLPREFYAIAVKTGDKAQDTLTYFEEQRQSVGYTILHARRDAQKINSGKTIAQVAKEDKAERKAAVDNPPASANDGKDAAELIQGTLHLAVTKTPDNSRYLNLIIDTHGSFEKWFTTRCQEEFGDELMDDEDEE
jgi:hypothetical protein